MEQRLYPAFGHILVRSSLQKGELFNDPWMKDGVISIDATSERGHAIVDGRPCFWAVATGKHKYTNLDTNEIVILNPNWTNIKTPLSNGRQELSILEDSESICLVNDFGPAKGQPLPDLEVITLRKGEEMDFEQGTNLYLIEGELFIANMTFPKMRQIKFKTEGRTVLATTDSFILIFK